MHMPGMRGVMYINKTPDLPDTFSGKSSASITVPIPSYSFGVLYHATIVTFDH